MEIRVYDKDLFRIGQLENQISLIWTRKYFEPGDFELHAPITEKNLSLFQKGNLISYKGAVDAGIIEDIEKEESDLKNEITIKGRFLSSYMDRRLIKDTYNFAGKAEDAVFAMYDRCIEIPHVVKAQKKGFPERIEFQATMKNLLLYQIKVSRSSNIAFHFQPDFVNHNIVFETYQGTDHSSAQSQNNRVIFSEEYNNLKNVIYKFNDQALKTCAIVGGEGEGSSRIYVQVGSGEGLDLREVFVDARDLQRGELSEEDYKAKLKQRGLEALNSSIVAESLESVTDPAINFNYKEDYDLGDIVTVRKKKWGLLMNQRITEIQEVYEYGGGYIVPTLGSPLPDSMDWRDD